MATREVLMVDNGEVRPMNERELEERAKDAAMPWQARLRWGADWCRKETAAILEEDRVARVKECAEFEIWKTELHARLKVK